MAQLQRILTAIADLFGWLFILPDPAARRRQSNGFNFPALCVVCFTAILAACSGGDGDWTQLHQAAKGGDIAEVKHLIDGGADVNAKAADGVTPLHFAVQNQSEVALTLVLALVKAGANIDAKGALDMTPMHVAVENRAEVALTLVLALVKAGADINAKGIGGRMPLHLAIYHGRTEVALALIKEGADVNAKIEDGNVTPMHAAAYKGHIEVVRALVKAGADLHASTNDGQTPLDIAIEFNGEDSEIVRILRETMAKQGG